LWRDSRLTDTYVKANWPLCEREVDDIPNKYLSAQLILRNADGKILQSRDFGREFEDNGMATMNTLTLGDPPTQTIEVSRDTYRCAGRWGGSTHMFARIERAQTIWYECAEMYSCALGCGFRTDLRSGSYVRDLLAWREGYDERVDAMDPITTFARVTLRPSGKCETKKRSKPNWCDNAPGEICEILASDWPAP
jgi:hypothetical protein